MQVPAILPMVCKAAGWSHNDFLEAVSFSRTNHGLFNSITAELPQGMKTLPPTFPIIEVRPTKTGLSVNLDFGKEKIACGGQGTATLTLMGTIVPETLKAAAAGLPIAKLAGHSLLKSKSFVIERVYEPLWGDKTIVVFLMPNCDFTA